MTERIKVAVKTKTGNTYTKEVEAEDIFDAAKQVAKNMDNQGSQRGSKQ